MSPARDPAPVPGPSKTRPIGRTGSRIFVIAFMVIAFALAAGGMYLIIRSANDPDVQRQIQEIERLEADREAAADTTRSP